MGLYTCCIYESKKTIFNCFNFICAVIYLFIFDMCSAVSSKMLNVIAPSLSVVSSDTSTSKSADSSSIEKADPAYLDIDDNVGLSSGNLSSTLQKLLLWEKKLYQEVKVFSVLSVFYFNFIFFVIDKFIFILLLSHYVCN